MKSLKLFSLAFFTYLVLTLYTNVFLKDKLYGAELDMSRIWVALLVVILFFVFLVAGYLKPAELPAWAYWLMLFVFSFALPLYGVIAVAFIFLFSMKYNPFEKHAHIWLILSIILLGFIYLLRGIPLFNWGLRFGLSKILVFLAFLSGVSLVYVNWSIKFKTLVFLILEMLFFLGTFRSLMLLIFLMYILPLYFEERLTLDKICLAIPVFLLILYLSGSLEGLLVRIGFTFLIFHNLVHISMPFGIFHGKLLLHSDPRWRIAFMFTLKNRYTYFLFGQAVADFGIFGVIEAYFIGTLLKLSERNLKTATIVLSTIIYAIESGIDAFLLSVLILFGALYSKTNIKTLK
ncbi:hypothetical protein [Thermococcus barophilus]|uniref:Uncharacterized protein n=1 Tax=Thermococcus barophilus (strain DSM 11836 / MP) TaxID=391623 RepID=F0LMC8_THEBM|nr:hypothetical protein [Thermococcus barophilus]ADT85151.1 hypothetical protein TERMP_02177 [Thermococcus barophilus MP]